MAKTLPPTESQLPTQRVEIGMDLSATGDVIQPQIESQNLVVGRRIPHSQIANPRGSTEVYQDIPCPVVLRLLQAVAAITVVGLLLFHPENFYASCNGKPTLTWLASGWMSLSLEYLRRFTNFRLKTGVGNQVELATAFTTHLHVRRLSAENRRLDFQVDVDNHQHLHHPTLAR